MEVVYCFTNSFYGDNKNMFDVTIKLFELSVRAAERFHKGHYWLINERLKEGKNVCIAIRDVETNEKQPWSAEVIKKDLEVRFQEEIKTEKIKVIIIPDIESVNYGRGVGYEIIEHVPPTDVKEISATKIREQMRKDGKL